MKIAIKYCGGCNPIYDRVACVNNLKSLLSNVEWVSYNESDSFDYCLLVRGCNRGCVSEKKFSNCRQVYAASSEEDFLEIKNKLRAQIMTDEYAE